jgi:hypothetical protein
MSASTKNLCMSNYLLEEGKKELLNSFFSTRRLAKYESKTERDKHKKTLPVIRKSLNSFCFLGFNPNIST